MRPKKASNTKKTHKESPGQGGITKGKSRPNVKRFKSNRDQEQGQVDALDLHSSRRFVGLYEYGDHNWASTEVSS